MTRLRCLPFLIASFVSPVFAADVEEPCEEQATFQVMFVQTKKNKAGAEETVSSSRRSSLSHATDVSITTEVAHDRDTGSKHSASHTTFRQLSLSRSILSAARFNEHVLRVFMIAICTLFILSVFVYAIWDVQAPRERQHRSRFRQHERSVNTLSLRAQLEGEVPNTQQIPEKRQVQNPLPTVPVLGPLRAREPNLLSTELDSSSNLPSHPNGEVSTATAKFPATMVQRSGAPSSSSDNQIPALCPILVLNTNARFRIPFDSLGKHTVVPILSSNSQFLEVQIDIDVPTHSGAVTLSFTQGKGSLGSMRSNKNGPTLGSMRSNKNGPKIIYGRRDMVYGELKFAGRLKYQLLYGKHEIAQLSFVPAEAGASPGHLILTSKVGGSELARGVQCTEESKEGQRHKHLEVTVSKGMDPVLALLCVLGAMLLS